MTTFLKTVYKGSLKAVVLDWAGTVVDFGCIGPASVFTDVFKSFGIEVSVKEARQFMGMAKREHVASMLYLPETIRKWREKYGNDPGEKEVDLLYEKIEPAMIETVKRFAEPIPGALEAVEAMRSRGMKIGSSTGYTRPMMDNLMPLAAKHGYVPDAVVCASDVPKGRPAPYMIWKNAEQLDVYPHYAVVKIGDTISDVKAGINAGVWSVGLALCGNEAGLSQDELAAVSEIEKNNLRKEIARNMYEAGAHYVIDALSDIEPVLNEINNQLDEGINCRRI